MLLASIRLGFLLAALIASLHVAAAPRFWTLTGVQFNEAPFPTGRTGASGYFSYDDATRTVTIWNLRTDGFFGYGIPAFTYVPGNSTVNVSQPSGAGQPTLAFSAVIGVSGTNVFVERRLQITPLVALDGANAAVSLLGREDLLEREYIPPSRGRSIAAGSLTLTPVPPPVVIAQVDEFYNPALRHYFITADGAEKLVLDTGVHPGWVRTGESFKAYAKGSSTGGSINPVCRFYSPPFFENDDGVFTLGVDSHFFSADAGECLTVFRKYAAGIWEFESENVFQIDLPDETSGTCPDGTIPVYRLWNQRTDSNHRYTTSTAIKAAMLAEGYVAEGYGSDGVAMCAVP